MFPAVPFLVIHLLFSVEPFVFSLSECDPAFLGLDLLCCSPEFGECHANDGLPVWPFLIHYILKKLSPPLKKPTISKVIAMGRLSALSLCLIN
jgi:hypothetical protein